VLAGKSQNGKLYMIKAVIFDFGRVISEQKPNSLFRQYEEDLGLAPGTINPLMFDSTEWQEALVGRKTSQQFWYDIGPALGLETPEEIDGFRNRYQADEALNQGVLKVIHTLHGRYKLAVLSNSPPGLKDWLREWGMLDFFEIVFCSGDEGVVKPQPAAFKITLERLLVKPAEAVFIDDTSEHVEAARMLGLDAILFTTAAALEQQLSHLVEYGYVLE
jgi:putative hydrolase of the HAD superfamily